MTTEYQIHPAAEIFPMLTKGQLRELADDIKKNGVKEPGVLYQGKILDGRNRALACDMAGVEMWWEEFEEKPEFDPIAFVLSKNLHRRHLTREQRVQVMKKLRALGQTCRQIATATGASKATVARVVSNETTGSPAKVKGKDGKQYPAKKRKRADPPARKVKKQSAAKPPVAPVDDEPCRVCGAGMRADGDRCQRCIDKDKQHPDGDVVVESMADPKALLRDVRKRLDEDSSGALVDSLRKLINKHDRRDSLARFREIWDKANDSAKDMIRAYATSH